MDGSLLKCLSRTGQICASIFGHKPGLEELSEHRGSFLLTFIAGKFTEGLTNFALKDGNFHSLGGTWRFDAWKNRSPSGILEV